MDAPRRESLSRPATLAGRRSGDTLPLHPPHIAANPELQERELIKMATLAGALAAGLRARGVPDPDASLAAEAGIVVFRVAFETWVGGAPDVELGQVVRESLDRFRSVTT